MRSSRQCLWPGERERAEQIHRTEQQSLIRSARQRGLEVMLTRREADVLRLRECAYCGQLPAGGIDRLAAAGEYNVENCVPCCRACNIAKKDRPPWHFVLSCRAVVEFRRNGRASGWTTAVMLRSQTRYKDWLSDARNRRQIEVGISRAQFETLTQQPCVFCGLEQCGGVDRRDASGVYDVENCQPACKVCNFAKNNVSDAAFIALCERVVRSVSDIQLLASIFCF